MNNLTKALQMPTWTTEVQQYINKVQHHTPIIFRTFRKTIAPVIATTAKDLSRYYILCLKGANHWGMKVTGVTYNPITATVRAAAAELSSAEARVTYSRIGHILHERLVDGLIVAHYGIAGLVIGFSAARSAYRAGAKLYHAVYNRINPGEPLPTILPSVELAVSAAETDQALHEVANIAEAKEIVQPVDQDITPDFWTEPFPVFHTPPIFGPIWNPAPRDIHVEVARLLELQHVPLMLAPAPVVEQPAPKPKAETKAPRCRGKATAEVGQAAKSRVKKERSRSKMAVE